MTTQLLIDDSVKFSFVVVHQDLWSGKGYSSITGWPVHCTYSTWHWSLWCLCCLWQHSCFWQRSLEWTLEWIPGRNCLHSCDLAACYLAKLPCCDGVIFLIFGFVLSQANWANLFPWNENLLAFNILVFCALFWYKKFELMLTRRAKAYSSSCSQTVSLSPANLLQFILGVCTAAEGRRNQ